MQPHTVDDYKKLLTQVIAKQIAILGPQITLSKARSVQGLIVADDGTVTDIVGSPAQIVQSLVNEFVALSGLIVQKTMEPLLTGLPYGQAAPVQATSSVSTSPAS